MILLKFSFCFTLLDVFWVLSFLRFFLFAICDFVVVFWAHLKPELVVIHIK